MRPRGCRGGGGRMRDSAATLEEEEHEGRGPRSLQIEVGSPLRRSSDGRSNCRASIPPAASC
eukprot:2156941-Pyramimonas_sp.AAC.1